MSREYRGAPAIVAFYSRYVFALSLSEKVREFAMLHSRGASSSALLSPTAQRCYSLSAYCATRLLFFLLVKIALSTALIPHKKDGLHASHTYLGVLLLLLYGGVLSLRVYACVRVCVRVCFCLCGCCCSLILLQVALPSSTTRSPTSPTPPSPSGGDGAEPWSSRGTF